MSEQNPRLIFEIQGEALRVIAELPTETNSNTYLTMLIKLVEGGFNQLIGEALTITSKVNPIAEEIRKHFLSYGQVKPVMSPVETLKRME